MAHIHVQVSLQDMSVIFHHHGLRVMAITTFATSMSFI